VEVKESVQDGVWFGVAVPVAVEVNMGFGVNVYDAVGV
jgi:hypothetical protein